MRGGRRQQWGVGRAVGGIAMMAASTARDGEGASEARVVEVVDGGGGE